MFRILLLISLLITQHACTKAEARIIPGGSGVAAQFPDGINNTAGSCFNAIRTSSVTGPSNSTVGPVLFDTADFNTNTSYNSATGVFTAPIAGRYLFNAGIMFLPSTTSGIAHTVRVFKNGSAFRNISTYLNPVNASSRFFLSGSIIMSLSANDTVDIRASSDTAGATTLCDLTTTTYGACYFSGCQIN